VLALAARVAETYGYSVEDVLYRMPASTAVALYEERRRIEYERAMPTLLVGYQEMVANWPSEEKGPPPSWRDYVPAYLRPDPLMGIDLSDEALRDINWAIALGGLGSEELARLTRLLGGVDALAALEERYA